jgi:hypothetical protein
MPYRIAGEYLDDQGEPIEGARIIANVHTTAAVAGIATTDADGLWELNALPSDGELLYVSAFQDGFVPNIFAFIEPVFYTAPSAPTLSGELIGPTATLTMSAAPGAFAIEEFQVWRSIDGGDYELVFTIPAIDSAAVYEEDPEFDVDVNYYVIAVDTVGTESDDSNIVTLEAPAAGLAFIDSFMSGTLIQSSMTNNVSDSFTLASPASDCAVFGHHMLTNGNTSSNLVSRTVTVRDSSLNVIFTETVFLDTIEFIEINANYGRWFLPLGNLAADTYTVTLAFTYSNSAVRRFQFQAMAFAGVNQEDAAIPFDSMESYNDVAPQDSPLEIFPEAGDLVISMCCTGGTTGTLDAVATPSFTAFAGSLAGSSFDMNLGYRIADNADTQEVDWDDAEDGGHSEILAIMRAA